MTVSRGQMRVGVAFNPSGSERVAAIKTAAAAFIDLVDALPGEGASGGEIARLKALAMTDIEAAAMWAVKAATK